MSEAALLQDDATGVQRARGASVLSCIINLASTCMGTGILALPSAYDHAGFTAGSLLCVGSAVLTIVSLNLLSAAAELVPDRTRRVTFYTLCESALPHSGRVIDLAVLINCLGCCIAYLIVAADCFSRLGVPGFSRIAWVGLGAALVATPCHFSTMDMLKVTSSIAVASLLVISALILAFAKGWYEGLDPCPGHSSVLHGHCGGVVNYGSAAPVSILCTLPLFINAFTCQQNVLALLGELHQPTAARKRLVLTVAPLLPMCLYLTVATAGYLTFGHGVASNVMNSYPETSFTTAARAVLGGVVLCNYPLNMAPSRRSLLSLIDSCAAPKTVIAPEGEGLCAGGSGGIFLSERRERVITSAFLLGTAGIACLVTDLGAVVSLIGATGAAIIALVAPGTSYLLLAWRVDGRAPSRGAAALLSGLGLLVISSHFFCP